MKNARRQRYESEFDLNLYYWGDDLYNASKNKHLVRHRLMSKKNMIFVASGGMFCAFPQNTSIYFEKIEKEKWMQAQALRNRQ